MKILAYTSPAKGHLYPLIPILKELRERGHDVTVKTLASELERVRALGMHAEAMDPAIEAREIDDWKASNPPAALLKAINTFSDRAKFETGDLQAGIEKVKPDVLLIDVNSWGAGAAAEASGIPWASFAPYFLPVKAPGSPPWGLGLVPQKGLIGKIRDNVLWAIVNLLYDRALPGLNRLRSSVGVPPLKHVVDVLIRAPRVLALTTEPFEYSRKWPENIRMIGPGIWEPDDTALPPSTDDRPLVLVTCSTEFQNDSKIIETALAALENEPVRVVATTASIDPAIFKQTSNARVERFLPHGPLLKEAACVVCHGGMGITQKALAAGVPVCAVPWGRDQGEVAMHVEVAGAGVMLKPGKLNAENLRKAVYKTMACKPGAQKIAEAFKNSGGPKAAADILEELAGKKA